MMKWTSDASLSKERQAELVSDATPLSQIPRDFHINREDLKHLFVPLEKDQKFAFALLALNDTRYGNVSTIILTGPSQGQSTVGAFVARS